MSEINTLTVNGKAYRLADAAVREQVGQMAEQLDACAIMAEACADAIAIDHGSDNKLRVMNLYGKTAQDGTPTPAAPVEPVSVGDGGSIDIRVTGKNLISLPYAGGDYYEKNGLTFAVQEDGSVIVNGTATADTTYNLTGKIASGFRVGKTYTLSGSPIDSDYSKYFIRFQTTGGNANTYGAGGTITLTDISEVCRIYIQIRSGIVANNLTFRPQLELGNTATEYETPKTPQTCSVGGYVLRGIPVSENGNYTDGNGQMWLTDEIDLVNKKLIKRICTVVLDGAEPWTYDASSGMFRLSITNMAEHSIAPAYCTHFSPRGSSVADLQFGKTGGKCYFKYDALGGDLNGWRAWLEEQEAAGVPVTITYALSGTEEQALGEDVLTSFGGLYTNKPNTTVCSGSGAGIRVSYTADTKLYIDNKFTELAAALVNNT